MLEIRKRIKRAFKNKGGETIVETLAAMLVAVLAFMVLAGAIVASARVNAKTGDMTLYLDASETGNETESEATLQIDTGSTTGGDVTNSMIEVGNIIKSYSGENGGGNLYHYE